MDNISPHINYSEATHTDQALYWNNNDPNEEQLANMRAVALAVFEPLRNYFGVPIGINSFFRSENLNAAIGGAIGSQHCKGEAIDIDDTLGGVTNAQLFWHIKDNLPFDQLIWENGDDDNPDWVHVSFKRNGKNRRDVKMYRNGVYGAFEQPKPSNLPTSTKKTNLTTWGIGLGLATSLTLLLVKLLKNKTSN